MALHKKWRLLRCYTVQGGGPLSPDDPRIVLAQYFGVLHDGRAFYGNGNNLSEARRDLHKVSGVFVPKIEPEPWQRTAMREMR